MGYSQHNRHGNIPTGRIMVVAGCLAVLVANGLVFREAAAFPHPLPPLEVIAVISLLWVFAGAWGMCMRKIWGRSMALTVLYAGSLSLFVSIMITLTGTSDGVLVGRLEPLIIADGIYLLASLVLTKSKHVRRLTSRQWE
jgi:hypothetical protein